ncbi:aldo/keto reductase [Malaciobacter molluscorum LMG 25693]|uniref:Aldo/keto reductase n=1 Tax=Malaciobacter molluscorum LMG 25693 TaxID=870501 RepID=A0A2G1DIY0_9BACT|nr:aldo/keto reductase [Malaciobacter molluscorum]AXX93197.1 aldo/keto reductase [Malaciobacter molluscorum LMG 25693]PHO18452.1 aldo/keto reductase [Malaciobacter molluscorum LMG 25693]
MSYATAQSTLNYAKKFSHYQDFYIKHNDLIFSKLGLGTFNKEPYKEENYVFHYIEGVKEAIRNGINLIDTASNYRYGQSEKEIAIAIKELINDGEISREELIVCSKAGFIQLDYPFPKNPYTWIEDNIISKKLATREDIELDQHCMTPAFLEWSCKKSLNNLQLDSIDIYFLHNPEMQLISLGYKKFLKKIEKVFERFEKMVNSGQIKYYGVAVWNALINDENSKEHINLEDLVKIAVKIAGRDHKFKYIQTPFNLAKTSIYTIPTQIVTKERCTVVQAAHRLGLGLISSSSLLQMNLFKRSFKSEIGYLLDSKMVLENDIQLALQFVRSTPGIISSLFASKVPVHIKSNLEITKIKSVPRVKYDLIYKV